MSTWGVYLVIVAPSLLGCVLGWGALAFARRRGWG